MAHRSRSRSRGRLSSLIISVVGIMGASHQGGEQACRISPSRRRLEDTSGRRRVLGLRVGRLARLVLMLLLLLMMRLLRMLMLMLGVGAARPTAELEKVQQTRRSVRVGGHSAAIDGRCRGRREIHRVLDIVCGRREGGGKGVEILKAANACATAGSRENPKDVAQLRVTAGCKFPCRFGRKQNEQRCGKTKTKMMKYRASLGFATQNSECFRQKDKGRAKKREVWVKRAGGCEELGSARKWRARKSSTKAEVALISK